MSYIGTEPKDIRSFGRTKFDYTATQGQTAFTGADDDGKVLAFTVGQIEVYVNGILMDDSDFTTTGTGTVTLATAANLNDVINIVSFETNIPDSNYVPASGGTFTGNVSMSGTLGVTGAVTASNGLTVDDDGATVLTVDRATNEGDIIDVQKDGTSVGSIGVSGGNNMYLSGQASNHAGVTFATQSILPTTQGTVNNNTVDLGQNGNAYKDLYLSGGAYIGGTGAANKLHLYEEGSFTYTINVGTSGYVGTVQATYTNTAYYTKIGKLVCVQYPSYAVQGNAQAVYSYTLPFTSARDGTGHVAEARGSQFRYGGVTISTTTHGPYGFFAANDTNVFFGYSDTSQDFSGFVYYPTSSGSSYPRVTVTYQATT